MIILVLNEVLVQERSVKALLMHNILTSVKFIELSLDNNIAVNTDTNIFASIDEILSSEIV